MNTPNDAEIVNLIIEQMGNIYFNIYIPLNEDDYFILVDSCSITLREKINQYPNQDILEVSTISFPLSSKLFIEFYSSKSVHCPEHSEIKYIDSNITQVINKQMLKFAFRTIACENENYLRKLVV